MNLVRSELARMDPTTRAALRQAATSRVKADPDLTEPLSAVCWAIAVEIHRLDQQDLDDDLAATQGGRATTEPPPADSTLGYPPRLPCDATPDVFEREDR